MTRLKRFCAITALVLGTAFALFLGSTPAASACGSINYASGSPGPAECNNGPDKLGIGLTLGGAAAATGAGAGAALRNGKRKRPATAAEIRAAAAKAAMPTGNPSDETLRSRFEKAIQEAASERHELADKGMDAVEHFADAVTFEAKLAHLHLPTDQSGDDHVSGTARLVAVTVGYIVVHARDARRAARAKALRHAEEASTPPVKSGASGSQNEHSNDPDHPNRHGEDHSAR